MNLDELISPGKNQRNNQKQILPPIDMNRSKDGSNMNDLDDIDDLLNGVNNNKKQQQTNKVVINNQKEDDQWDNFEGGERENNEDMKTDIMNDDLWGNKMTASSILHPIISIDNNSNQNFNPYQNKQNNQSSLQQQSVTNFPDILKAAYESFHLLFKDPIAGMPSTIFNLFKGDFHRDMDSSDFIQSNDSCILNQKYLILQSLRMAFHYSVEQFIMGEFEVTSQHQEFIKEVKDIESEWFFAGEEYLWNKAIELNLPNLERIISKKGSFFAHRLRYGKTEESQFYVIFMLFTEF